jgi:predicted ArsR family transcriptional regulator
MLLQLLDILRSGGAHTLREIARQLDVSEALVQGMIDELVHLGYLKLAAQACPGSCESCPMASCCAIGSAGRLWTLTEAASRAPQPKNP